MMTTMKIKVPSAIARTGWKFIEDLPFTAEEIVEIVGRYCDAQDHAKNYRVRRAESFKVMKAELESRGVDLKSLVS